MLILKSIFCLGQKIFSDRMNTTSPLIFTILCPVEKGHIKLNVADLRMKITNLFTSSKLICEKDAKKE